MVEVTPTTLVLHITANPAFGSVPLRVRFAASVSGGSGTYLTAVWNFGDGNSASGFSVNETYINTGQYTARFAVTDSDNETVSDIVSVEANVSKVPGNISSNPSPGCWNPTTVTGLLAVAVLAMAVVVARLWWTQTPRSGWNSQ